MKINKQVKFYVYLKSKLGRNADLLNFLFLQELGTGKYLLPELCSQLEVSRSNFNASLIRLKKEGVICYSCHSSNGILYGGLKKILRMNLAIKLMLQDGLLKTKTQMSKKK